MIQFLPLLFENLVEKVGLKCIEDDVDDVLLARQLEHRFRRTTPPRRRIRIGLQRRHQKNDALHRHESAARKRGERPT